MSRKALYVKFVLLLLVLGTVATFSAASPGAPI